MNLFEAAVSEAGGSELALDVPGLGALRVPHPEPVWGEIGVAVRPEKVRLSEARPADAEFSFEATVEDFAYYGSETHLFLVTEAGVRLSATVPNTDRGPVRIERGARRFVSWRPADTLVLTD